MSFNRLQTRILDEARAQADSIAASFSTRKEQRQQEITAKIQALQENSTDAAKAAAVQQAQSIIQTTKLQSRAAILIAKQKELDSLEHKLREHLLALTPEETRKLLRSLLAHLPEGSQGEILAGDQHAKILASLSSTRKIAKETLPQEGGFIYRGGQIELNLTISHLTRQLCLRHRAQLARLLWQ